MRAAAQVFPAKGMLDSTDDVSDEEVSKCLLGIVEVDSRSAARWTAGTSVRKTHNASFFDTSVKLSSARMMGTPVGLGSCRSVAIMYACISAWPTSRSSRRVRNECLGGWLSMSKDSERTPPLCVNHNNFHIFLRVLDRRQWILHVLILYPPRSTVGCQPSANERPGRARITRRSMIDQSSYFHS